MVLTLKPQSGSLLHLSLEEMRRRNAVHADRYLPFYLSSMILHRLNIANQKKPFYTEESGPYNLRMHVLYLSPTGGGKTYWVKNLGRQTNALFRNTIPISYKGSMTAAAFTGTLKFGSDGKVVPIDGIAKKCQEHVVMIEEFHSTLKSMDRPHGDDLENHFLTALDSGWVFRDLAAGDIAFQTHVTLIAASQFTRIKTSSGMLRRFIVVSFKPTREDMMKLRIARRLRRKLIYTEQKTLIIRKYFMELGEDILEIEGIAFEEDKIDAFFDKLSETHFMPHYDEDIYERFLIGLNLIMQRDIGTYPVITITPAMEDYIKMAVQWRHEALMGSELSLSLSTIEDFIATENSGMPTSVYRITMINFGLSFEESANILKKLQNYGKIRVSNSKIYLKD